MFCARAQSQSRQLATTDLMVAAKMGGILRLLNLILTTFPPTIKQNTTRSSDSVTGMRWDVWFM